MLLWIVIEKICVAKIFGMKVAFKWNNKCAQVETIQVYPALLCRGQLSCMRSQRCCTGGQLSCIISDKKIKTDNIFLFFISVFRNLSAFSPSLNIVKV